MKAVVMAAVLVAGSASAQDREKQYLEGAGMGYARAAAAVEGEYRLSHLETHRRMRDLLDAEQVKRYDELRGYASGKAQHHKH